MEVFSVATIEIQGWGCMAAADARTFVVLAHWHSTSSSATCVRAGTAGVISRAPGGAVLAAAGIAAEYSGELYPRTCPAMSSTPLLAGEAGISATLESGRTNDVVGDARPQPHARRGDDDGEEHHGGEERPGAAWARSS